MRIKKLSVAEEAVDCYTNSSVTTLENVWRTVWRKPLLMLGRKVLKTTHFLLYQTSG